MADLELRSQLYAWLGDRTSKADGDAHDHESLRALSADLARRFAAAAADQPTPAPQIAPAQSGDVLDGLWWKPTGDERDPAEWCFDCGQKHSKCECYSAEAADELVKDLAHEAGMSGERGYRNERGMFEDRSRWYDPDVLAAAAVAQPTGGEADDVFRDPTQKGRQLGVIIASLLDTYKPEGVGIWLNSPNRNLGGRPLDLIAAGDGGRVLAEADRLSGGPTR